MTKNYLKNDYIQRAAGVTQAVEALNSNPSTTKDDCIQNF
jgi:hypothetical protein